MRILRLHILIAGLLLTAFAQAQGQAYSTFTQALDDIGAEGLKDWSTEASINIEEPRMAYINITGVNALPTRRTPEVSATLTALTSDGNYFRLPISMHLHGNYSTRFPKQSFTWSTKSAELEIGNWVGQDGFIMMAFYTDFTRGIGEIGYKAFRRIQEDRLPYPMRGGYEGADSRAQCFPDGFPCAVYVNDKFQGIYAWQLKKSRKNMGMKKHTPTHIHLDGDLRDDYIFRGKISWNRFEVRNPQDLVTRYGKSYDGANPTELADATTAASADPASIERSAQVKSTIIAFSQYWNELRALEVAGADTLQMKAEISRRYDIESLLDYYIFFRVQMNGDGTLKNWQWFTYDGVKWFVTPYDLDQTMGLTIYGFPRPASLAVVSSESGPLYWIEHYFLAEERARYHELRQSGALSTLTFREIIEDWCGRITPAVYAQEEFRWPQSPCYLDPVCSAGWKVSEHWEEYALVDEFSISHTYHAGDRCRTAARIWEATTTVIGHQPYILNTGRDSLERLLTWVDERIPIMDAFYGYTDLSGISLPEVRQASPLPPSYPSADQHSPVHPSLHYDLQGRQLRQIHKGIYIENGQKRIKL